MSTLKTINLKHPDGTANTIQMNTSSDLIINGAGSGNLLVGKSSTTFSDVGAVIRSTGSATITRDGNDPLALNRKTSDGEILGFYKDGTAVGNIGSSASISGNFYIAGSSGLQFRSSDVLPTNGNGSYTNGSLDLGDGGANFNDGYFTGSLHTGGGIYINGGGASSSANHLDDYEEGTFTPSWTNTSSASYNTQLGVYTKIGNVVMFLIRLDTSTMTLTGPPSITGLPFTSRNTTNLYANQYTFPVLGFQNFGDGGIVTQVGVNSSQIQLYYLTNGGGINYNVVDGTVMNEGSQMIITVTGFYYV